MAHVKSLFLSAIASSAFFLGLAPGCSNNTAPPPEVAIGSWTITPGNSSTNELNCGAGAGVTFSIGNPEGSPIQTVSDGQTQNGVPVSVSCTVSPSSGGFNVNAKVAYGTEGTLTISGTFSAPSNATPPTATNIDGEFSSGFPGYIAQLADSACTVTFTNNAHMGIAATRIWGYIDCSDSKNQDGQDCDAHAEFLFENCGQ